MWSTTSTRDVDAPAQDVWASAYADAADWPRWNPELAWSRLDGPLRQGAVIRSRFRTGLRLRFRVTEFEEGRLFTDEARLPGARLRHRHVVDDRAGGGSRLTNTIEIEGPLARVWAAAMGRRAEGAVRDGQRLIEQLAQGRA